MIPNHWRDTAGRGVKIVVLDTGVSVGQGGVFPEAIRCFAAAGADPSHGTKVAQIIAGRHGIASACRLFCGQVIGDSNHLWVPLEQALVWAKELKADVVNMSFACPTSHPPVDRLLAELDAASCICVTSFNRYLHWPWSLPHVVAVGVSQQDDCDIVAPSEFPVEVEGRGEIFKGTSAAAAQVAGIAACAKAADPNINRQKFFDYICGFANCASGLKPKCLTHCV